MTADSSQARERTTARADSAASVECDSVTRTYRRGSPSVVRRLFGTDRDRPSVDAVADVTLAIDPGSFVGITGPSGSGKSTLLHLLAGLDTVGVVFQHFHLLDALSARANVALPLVERGVGTGERRRRAEELLELVGLEDRTDHKPRELSGGEQQRVAIARALATDPALVVADEPTGELDSATADRILDVLASIAGDQTVVLATHDRQVLDRVERTVRLVDGRRPSTNDA